MSITVCLSARSLEVVDQGGHRWAFLNWALGLQKLGCEVIWLETVRPDRAHDGIQEKAAALKADLAPYGLGDRVAVCSAIPGTPLKEIDGCLDLEAALEADVLLNFKYALPAALVRGFRKSALIDIDPGLLQLWIADGAIDVAPHNVYFTIGETVGEPGSGIPDLGLTWHHTAPCVALDWWIPTDPAPEGMFTTIANWWAGAWLGNDPRLDDKRSGFVPFLDLPARTPWRLELALSLQTDRWDMEEREALIRKGWSVRHAPSVARTPFDYQQYIRQSSGEFSCAKPACIRLQNAWLSDRTACYLASGKPAVVQHTGRSRFLPEASGLFRFHDLDDAVKCLDTIAADYERQCHLARAFAEQHLDAKKRVAAVLEVALN